MLDKSIEAVELSGSEAGKLGGLSMRLLNERHYLEELAKSNRQGFMIEKSMGLAGLAALGGLALIGAPAVAGLVGAIGLVNYAVTCVKESQHTGDFRPLPNRHNVTGVAAGFVRGADKIDEDNSIEDDTLYLTDKEYGRWILLHSAMPQTVQVLSQFTTEDEQQTALDELGNLAYRQYGRTFRSDRRCRAVAASQSCGVHVLKAYAQERHIESGALAAPKTLATSAAPDVQDSVIPQREYADAVATPIPEIQLKSAAQPMEPVMKTTQAPYDVALDLGTQPQSTIIAGVPGSGKGMIVSNAVRHLKAKNPTLTVMMVDPKGDEKESGYWTGTADIVRQFKLMSCSDPDTGATWLLRCLVEFNRLPSPKLLILDELLAVATELALADKELKAPQKLKKLLSGWVAQGDSQDVWVWAMTQSVNTGDLGLSAGVRGNLRAIGIVAGKNINAIEGLTSTRLIPPPGGGMDELRQLMTDSPVQRAFFDSKTAQWYSMPRLENHSGYDRDARSFAPGYSPVAAPRTELEVKSQDEPKVILESDEDTPELELKPPDEAALQQAKKDVFELGQVIIEWLKSHPELNYSFDSLKDNGSIAKLLGKRPSRPVLRTVLDELTETRCVRKNDDGSFQWNQPS